jgi:hypothetical protein
MHKAANYRLENTFLTADNTCAMQWYAIKDKRVDNVYTVWLDKDDKLMQTSVKSVPVDVVESCLAYYERNYTRMLSPSLKRHK